MTRSLLQKIALFMALSLLLTCFAGCKPKPQITLSDDYETEQPEPDSPVDETEEEEPEQEDEPEQKDEPVQKEESEEKVPVKEETPEQKDPVKEEEPKQEDPKVEENTPEEEDAPENSEENGKPAYDEAKKLTVVTYNIKTAMHGKTYDQIVEQINAAGADIVGFQEVDLNTMRVPENQIKILAGKAGFPYYYFEATIALDGDQSVKGNPDRTEMLYGHAVMSKYPIKKSQLVDPRAQNKEYEFRNFGRHEIDVDGTTVVFYNCHLDGSKGREQYNEIQEKWMSKDEYAICVGDFNETFSEFAAYFDFEKYYNFSWGDDDTGGSQCYRGKWNDVEVIDHIIVTKDKFVWREDEMKNGRYVTPHDGASDHNMIYCHLNLIK